MTRKLLLLTTAALALAAPAADAHQTGGAGANGRLLISSDRPGSLMNDVWSVNPDGTGGVDLSKDPGWEGNAVVSPDGTKILFTASVDSTLDYDVFVMDAGGTNARNLTKSPGQDSQGVWSPDGSKIAYTSLGGGQQFDIWTMNADGSGRVNVTSSPTNEQGPAWSPDGSRIAFSDNRERQGVDVYTMAPDGSDVRNLTRRPGYDDAPVWSPDGSAIAYHSDAASEQGHSGIWLMRPDGSARAWVTRHSERGSHTQPVFSPDGRQIAFESNRLSAAGASDVFVISTDGTGERNITHDGSPSMEHPGGGAFANADSPGSWMTDRSVPAPAAAPIAFPPKGELRDPTELEARVRSHAGGRVKVVVGLMRKGQYGAWPGSCKGRVTVKTTAGARAIDRRAVRVANGAGLFCEASFAIKRPRGVRRITIAASFAGHEHFQPARVKKQVALPA